MNLRLDDDSLDKIYNNFELIKKKIALSDFTYESEGKEYLKTKVSNETCFKDNIIPHENTKYNCRVLLKNTICLL